MASNNDNIRKMIYVLFLLASAAGARAQTTQVMLQQIAALQDYISIAGQGYRIAEDGIHLVSDIKNKEFDLHTLFFASLQTVDPAIKDMPSAAGILSLQAAILNLLSLADNRSRGSPELQAATTGYANNISTLLLLTSNSDLKMTDGERATCIEAIHAALAKEYAALIDFVNTTDILAADRLRAVASIQYINKLYGL
jgi:hypothetical protein